MGGNVGTYRKELLFYIYILFADNQIIVRNEDENIDNIILKLLEQYENWGLIIINFSKTEHLRMKKIKKITNLLLNN